MALEAEIRDLHVKAEADVATLQRELQLERDSRGRCEAQNAKLTEEVNALNGDLHALRRHTDDELKLAADALRECQKEVARLQRELTDVRSSQLATASDAVQYLLRLLPRKRVS